MEREPGETLRRAGGAFRVVELLAGRFKIEMPCANLRACRISEVSILMPVEYEPWMRPTLFIRDIQFVLVRFLRLWR